MMLKTFYRWLTGCLGSRRADRELVNTLKELMLNLDSLRASLDVLSTTVDSAVAKLQTPVAPPDPGITQEDIDGLDRLVAKLDTKLSMAMAPVPVADPTPELPQV